MMIDKILKIFGLGIALLIIILSCLALVQYPGHGMVYIVFTITFNALLFCGFRTNRIFFDTFIGLFLWLGYWLKFSFRMAFMEGRFHEPIGMNFDFSGAAYDHALLVASCGGAALVLVSIIREKLAFNYPKTCRKKCLEGLLAFYKRYRPHVWCLFIFLFVFVAATNVYFGIYQRGATPRTHLPYKLSGIYTWLLLFGTASVSALILEFDLLLKKKNTIGSVFLALLETFFSSVSMLSRGMVLNASALAIGTLKSFKRHGITPALHYCLIVAFLFVLLFGLSIFTVTQLRDFRHFGIQRPHVKTFAHSRRNAAILILDRWVGIEGAMAVSSYPELGWDLWKNAWEEKYSNHGTSFYDKEIATSVYTKYDVSQHHYISLPGVIAFFYYPGSFLFLFVAMLLAGVLGVTIDLWVFRLGGASFILTALLAQVVASRYAHFGYVPGQSYLLFGTICMNVIIIFVLNKALIYHYKKQDIMGPMPQLRQGSEKS